MEQIDILMATYNGEKYLREQIESILNQTYKNIRLIISDDCSTDESRKIIEEYEKKDERVISYFQEQNLGYVKNFEFLLTKVKNEVYMLSDQDDVWNDTKVEKTYNKLKQCDADLVFTDLEFLSSDEETAKGEIDKAIKKFVEKVRRTIDFYKYDIIKASFQTKQKEDMLDVPELSEVKEKNFIYTGLNFIKFQIGENVYSAPRIGREAEQTDVTIDGLYQMIIYVYVLKCMIDDKKLKHEEFKDFIATNFSVRDPEYLIARKMQSIFINEQDYETFLKKYDLAIEEMVSLIIQKNEIFENDVKKGVNK